VLTFDAAGGRVGHDDAPELNSDGGGPYWSMIEVRTSAIGTPAASCSRAVAVSLPHTAHPEA